MAEQRSAPEDESAAFFSDLRLEAPYPSDTSYPNSLDIPGQPSSGDPWFTSSTHNLPHSWSDNTSSYPPYNPAGYGSSPGVSNSPWPGYEHSVEANSNNPTYYPNSPSYAIADQLSPSEQAFYNTNGNASVVGDPTLPLNYHRQPELLYPSAPSVPSAPSAASDVLSAQSVPFSALFTRADDSTNLSSYPFSGTSYRSRPATERSFGSSPEKPFECDQCGSRFSTRKDLGRHKPTHKQWPEGQRVNGLYHCRCGVRGHRKDNYKRHQRSCVPKNFTHEMFICKCSFETSEQTEHLLHIEVCRHGTKPRGRPPRSRAASELL